MARTRTLAQLRADVRYYADIEALTDRHPDANVNRLVNESWQALRELVSEQGSGLFLKAKSGTMTAGRMTPDSAGDPNLKAAFGTIDLPTDALRVVGVDLEINGRLVSCEALPFGARGDFLDEWSSDYTDGPFGFVVYDVGVESTTTVTAGKIALLPAPDAAYKYTVWYLPHWVDVATDSHVFNAMAGWEAWVIWDCVCKLTARDNDSRAAFSIAEKERARAEVRVLKSARIQRTGPLVVQDSRGRKVANRARAQRRWP